jgi:uncharacterized protein YdaU (DUF1376 family)
MNKSPAFQFYAADFLADEAVAAMTYEERGVYITLLSHAWMEGGIPSDLDQLARLLHLSRRRLDRVWPAIATRWTANGNGRLVNPRLERERKKQEEWRRKSAKGGRASGRSRSANHP